MTTTPGDYSAADVAAILDRTPDYIAARCRAGLIPGAYQLGPRSPWAIRRREFDAWHRGLEGHYRSPDRIEPPSNASRARIGARR